MIYTKEQANRMTAILIRQRNIANSIFINWKAITNLRKEAWKIKLGFAVHASNSAWQKFHDQYCGDANQETREARLLTPNYQPLRCQVCKGTV